MKLVYLILAISLQTTLSFSKTLREIVDDKAGAMQLLQSYYQGIQNYEFDSLENFVIHAPKFKDDYSYNQSYFEFRTKDEKEIIHSKTEDYERVWKEANQKQLTYFDFAQHELNYDEDLSAYPDNHIFLIFGSLQGLHWMYLITGGEDQRMLGTVTLTGFDLGNVEDVEVFMSIVQYYLVINSKIDLEGLDLKTMEGMVECGARSMRNLNKIFLQSINGKTLLLDEKVKSSKVEKIMEKKWTYSDYKFVSSSTISESAAAHNKDDYFIKVQHCPSLKKYNGAMNLNRSLVWFVNSVNGEVLYYVDVMVTGKGELEFETVLNNMLLSIDKYNTSGVISIGRSEYTHNSLPNDLSSSSICYVNLSKGDYHYNNWVNKSFEKKMKTYPYQYTILDKDEQGKVKKYDYQVKLAVEVIYVTKTETRNYGSSSSFVDHSKPTYTKTSTVPKEVFTVYLENTKSGETYCVQEESDWYYKSFKQFVKAASK